MFFDLLELIEVNKFTTLFPLYKCKEMHKDGRKHKVLTQIVKYDKVYQITSVQLRGYVK
jgi:hypothetical protein